MNKIGQKNCFFGSLNGISLITLVITIIVIIILAGAVILTLSQNNPIKAAEEAMFKSNIDSYKSELQLYITDQYVRTNASYDTSKLNATGDAVADIIQTMKLSDIGDFEIVEGNLKYVGVDDIKKGWASSILKTDDDTSEVAVNEGESGTPFIDNATINGGEPNYNNPVIPKGFFPVNTHDASWNISLGIPTGWNNGLVIQDASGNQFVWVPIDGTNVIFEKWCRVKISYDNPNIWDYPNPTGFNKSKIKDVYKGFYIARYEAMFDYNSGDIRAASKKSTDSTESSWNRDALHTGFLFNNVSYIEAKEYSKNMVQKYGYDETKLGTNIITGEEWDTVMKWLQNSGYNVVENSTSWGNVLDSSSPANISGYGSIQKSGNADCWKANNIYNLAGNLYEWTSEGYSDIFYILRGGIYAASGIEVPAAARNYFSGDSPGIYLIGFRPALYII